MAVSKGGWARRFTNVKRNLRSPSGERTVAPTVPIDIRQSDRVRRGLRSETEARAILEGRGYVVWRYRPVLHRRGRWIWSEPRDLFGAIDLTAMRREGLLFVQVTKGQANVSHHRRLIEMLPWPPSTAIEIWERQDRPPAFRVHVYLGGEGRAAWEVTETISITMNGRVVASATRPITHKWGHVYVGSAPDEGERSGVDGQHESRDPGLAPGATLLGERRLARGFSISSASGTGGRPWS